MQKIGQAGVKVGSGVNLLASHPATISAAKAMVTSTLLAN